MTATNHYKKDEGLLRRTLRNSSYNKKKYICAFKKKLGHIKYGIQFSMILGSHLHNPCWTTKFFVQQMFNKIRKAYILIHLLKNLRKKEAFVKTDMMAAHIAYCFFIAFEMKLSENCRRQQSTMRLVSLGKQFAKEKLQVAKLQCTRACAMLHAVMVGCFFCQAEVHSACVQKGVCNALWVVVVASHKTSHNNNTLPKQLNDLSAEKKSMRNLFSPYMDKKKSCIFSQEKNCAREEQGKTQTVSKKERGKIDRLL